MKRQTTLDFVAESQMEYSRLPSISTGAAYNSRPFDRRAISRGGVVHGDTDKVTASIASTVGPQRLHVQQRLSSPLLPSKASMQSRSDGGAGTSFFRAVRHDPVGSHDVSRALRSGSQASFDRPAVGAASVARSRRAPQESARLMPPATPPAAAPRKKKWRPHCKHSSCLRPASYADSSEKDPEFCDKHKEDGMQNVVHPNRGDCNHEGCGRVSAYASTADTQARFCYLHKKAGMVKVRDGIGTRCEEVTCVKQASFAMEGERYPRFCKDHKRDEMINIRNNRCVVKGCPRGASFAAVGERRGVYCGEHKVEGMINTRRRPRCIARGCNSREPTYVLEGEQIPKYCSAHRGEGMVDMRALKRSQSSTTDARQPARVAADEPNRDILDSNRSTSDYPPIGTLHSEESSSGGSNGTPSTAFGNEAAESPAFCTLNAPERIANFRLERQSAGQDPGACGRRARADEVTCEARSRVVLPARTSLSAASPATAAAIEGLTRLAGVQNDQMPPAREKSGASDSCGDSRERTALPAALNAHSSSTPVVRIPGISFRTRLPPAPITPGENDSTTRAKLDGGYSGKADHDVAPGQSSGGCASVVVSTSAVATADDSTLRRPAFSACAVPGASSGSIGSHNSGAHTADGELIESHNIERLKARCTSPRTDHNEIPIKYARRTTSGDLMVGAPSRVKQELETDEETIQDRYDARESASRSQREMLLVRQPSTTASSPLMPKRRTLDNGDNQPAYSRTPFYYTLINALTRKRRKTARTDVPACPVAAAFPVRSAQK